MQVALKPTSAIRRKPVGFQVGQREIILMGVGAVLYAGLSWLTNVFQLQAAQDLQVRPGVVVPIIFGFVFGPAVGFVTGALGNFLCDLVSGLLPYPAAHPMGNWFLDPLRAYLVNWQIGNGIFGLIPGLAATRYRSYFSLVDQLRALIFVVLGVLLGMGFAAFTHIFVDPTVSLNDAFGFYFLPLIRVNLANSIILVPIVLFNYERTDLRSTEWMSSGLMRRLLIAILVSAALPVGLLGMFLTQQATDAATGRSDLMVKLVFTIALSLLFTLANATMVAQSMTRPLLRLAAAARSMEAGTLTQDQAADLQSTVGTDEISRLSHIFGGMAKEVISREENLRAQVEQLRIEIDQTKKALEVSEIVDTEYFQQLRNKARQLREKKVEQQ